MGKPFCWFRAVASKGVKVTSFGVEAWLKDALGHLWGAQLLSRVQILITTRLDSDDGLGLHYVENVQKIAANYSNDVLLHNGSVWICLHDSIKWFPYGVQGSHLVPGSLVYNHD